MIPPILVNCKAYKQATGAGALALARSCEKAALNNDLHIGICAQSLDISALQEHRHLHVFAQHVDAVYMGAHTGWTPAEVVERAGAKGSLVNHSEHPLSFAEITSTIKALNKLGLHSVVCASNLSMVRKIVALRPDVIAYEPPELIGGRISVSTAKPSVIRKCVEAVGKKSRLYVGAGVKNAQDVRTALELGAHGVLVASGVVLAKSPVRALEELCEGFLE